jgi:hypothetical protein
MPTKHTYEPISNNATASHNNVHALLLRVTAGLNGETTAQRGCRTAASTHICPTCAYQLDSCAALLTRYSRSHSMTAAVLSQPTCSHWHTV